MHTSLEGTPGDGFNTSHVVRKRVNGSQSSGSPLWPEVKLIIVSTGCQISNKFKRNTNVNVNIFELQTLVLWERNCYGKSMIILMALVLLYLLVRKANLLATIVSAQRTTWATLFKRKVT